MEAVWITGIGFITSIGNNRSSVTESLRSMKHGIENPSMLQVEESPVKVAGTVKEFDVDSLDPEDWKYPEKIFPFPEQPLEAFLLMFCMHGVP